MSITLFRRFSLVLYFPSLVRNFSFCLGIKYCPQLRKTIVIDLILHLERVLNIDFMTCRQYYQTRA